MKLKELISVLDDKTELLVSKWYSVGRFSKNYSEFPKWLNLKVLVVKSPRRGLGPLDVTIEDDD